MRVIRTLVYEGPEDWIMLVLKKNAIGPDGPNFPLRDDCRLYQKEIYEDMTARTDGKSINLMELLRHE